MAAYGIGGLFQGFAQGMRLAGEEEDRKTRQELAKRQLDAADLALAKERDEAEYRSEIKRLYSDAEKNARGGTSGEVVDEFGVNLGRMTYLGDNRPEAGGLQFTGEQKQVAPRNPDTDPSYAQELLMRENAIKQKYGKMNRLEALKGVADFGKLMSTGAAEAANYFISSNDEAGALKMLRERSNMNLPEGTRLIQRTEKLFPEGPDAPWNTRKTFDVMSPDGTKLADYGAITRRAMDAKDVFNLETEQGKAMAQFAYQTKAIAETKRHNEETERLRGLDINNQKLQYEAVLKRMDEAALRQAEQLGIARDLRTASTLQNLFSGAQKEVFNLTGFQPIKAEELQYMPDAKKNEYFDRLAVAGYGTSIFEGNVDINKAKAGITPAMAVTFGKAYAKALQDPAARDEWNKLIKTDEDGRTYVESGKQRVFVPAVAVPSAPAGATPEPKRGVSKPNQPPPEGLSRERDTTFARERAALQSTIDQKVAEANKPGTPVERRQQLADEIRLAQQEINRLLGQRQ